MNGRNFLVAMGFVMMAGFATAAEAPVQRFQNGPWQCIDNPTDHSGELFAGCGASKWACYVEYKRKCENLNTHETWSTNFKKYTGVCAAQLSQCW